MYHLPQHVTRRLASVALAVAVLAGAAGCVTTEQKAGPSFQSVWPDPPEPARFHYEQTLRSSANIIEETSMDRLRRVATGETIAGKALDKPWGVTAYDGRIFVSDTVGRRIHVYDLGAKRYYEIGNSGVGALAKPLDMAVDRQGRLYVCDATSKRVVIFDLEGKYIGAVGRGEDLQRPSSVAVTPDGSRIFVVDTGGVSSNEHRVVVFDPEGNKIMTIGRRGNGPGEFNLPLGATVAPNGLLYVVDSGNFRVSAFNMDGQFQFSFGDVGRRSGQFARPKSIAADPDSNLYVTDASFGNFQIFDQKGKLLLFVGDRANEGMGGQFMLPAGIAVDPTDGRVYVVDQYFRKVDVFRPAATPPARPPRKASDAKVSLLPASGNSPAAG